MPRRKSKAKAVVAVIVVVLLVGALGTYLFVLAPKVSIVDWTHADAPMATSNLMVWQYSFSVTVKNSGMLSGKATIVCEFSYLNGTNMTSFQGERVVNLRAGEQAEFSVQVLLPAFDAIRAILQSEKSWDVRLT